MIHSSSRVLIPAWAVLVVLAVGGCGPVSSAVSCRSEAINPLEHSALMDNAASTPAEAHYDLFHAEPRSQLQPMVTDRPGQTNGPYTVAPGHLQIETGLIDYTYDHAARLSRIDVLGATEFRIGLVPDGELGVVLNPYSWQRQAGIVSTGFGDTSIQGKWTLWSDLSGNAGFGLIPSITFNTAQEHLGAGGTQGGLAFPLQLPLPADLSLGFMPAISAVPGVRGSGYDPQIAASISLSHTLVGNLSGFGEFAANIDTNDAGHWIGTVHFRTDLSRDQRSSVGSWNERGCDALGTGHCPVPWAQRPVLTSGRIARHQAEH